MRGRIFFLFLIFFLFSITLFYFWKTKIEKKKEREDKIKQIFEILNKKISIPENFHFYSISSFLNENFFREAKENLEKEKIDFLLVDLTENRIYLFKKGEFKKSFPILAQGKEGSFWETPAGLYQIEAKIKKHYSTIGQVFMPYSLQFQGNFFIHGWPYYPNGRPVETSFSGGCIRLSTENAKEIFQEIKVGTPLLVKKETFFSDNFIYQLKIPEVLAKSYLVADLKNNFIFLSKNIEEPLPIASITKLMTALISTEYINLWRKIKIESQDLIFTSQPRLKVGESWTGFDLLYPLLNESSNEAAKALARFLGENLFVELMNKKAKSLGLKNTHFKDTSGISKENFSSAKDLFFFSKYLYFNRKFLLDISRGEIYPYLLSKNFNNLKNFNCFKEKENFVGGKLGKTSEAGETLLAIFELDFKGVKRPISIIILNSKNVCQEAENLLFWLENSFE